MVYSGYRKQQPTFDCGLSWSYWSRSVQELRNIDSLTKNVPTKQPQNNVYIPHRGNKKIFLTALGERSLKQNSTLCVFLRSRL